MASQAMCLLTSSATSLSGPHNVASVSIAPGGASSLTPINVRSFHKLSSASSMATGGRAIPTSPTSPVKGPPCPSCHSPSKSYGLKLLQWPRPLLV